MIFTLQQNSPNPFNQITTINYDLEHKGHVQIMVYNILGKDVSVLVDEEQSKGSYSVTFNAESLPEGIYFCSMRVNNSSQSKKMAFLK